jgi:Family of unknown function (DUF5908)
MALEISEIAIQMVVDGEEKEEDEEKKKKKNKDDDGCCELDRQEIVDECVRRVMKMLRTRQER